METKPPVVTILTLSLTFTGHNYYDPKISLDPPKVIAAMKEVSSI